MKSKQKTKKKKKQEKVDRIKVSLAAKEIERNTIEERLNSTKALDDLKERESDLQHQNTEDQAIIQDENASPSDSRKRESGRKKRGACASANSD